MVRTSVRTVIRLNVEGTWIDANGNFLAGAHATPVYELLGKKGLNTMTMPAEKVGLLDGDIAFRMHEGGHTTGPNWPAFLEWAGRYIKPAGAATQPGAPDAHEKVPLAFWVTTRLLASRSVKICWLV